MRPTNDLGQERTAIKEAFFSCGMEILRPANYMIADTFPAEKREKISSQFDQSVKDEYDKAIRRARNLLYEQRNLVQDKWLIRYNIARSKHSGGEDWEELRSVLVDGALDRLSETLIAHSPLLVDKKYVDGLQVAIMRVTEKEKERLTEFLKSYHVARRPGVPKLDAEYEKE